MKNKELFIGLKGSGIFKALQRLQYWIAAISYLVVLSLSLLFLTSYLPHFSKAEVLDAGTLNILNAMLIIVVVFSTGAFGWEMLQWRKSRLKKGQPSIEDIIKGVNKESNSGNSL